jgi:hypothetical protein
MSLRSEKYYISEMAKNKRKALEKHMRLKDNEWMLEEMHEFGDEVHIAAYQAFKQNRMTKQEFQETVTAARDEWVLLLKKVREHEEQSEYLARLTGEISYSG